MQLKQSFEVIEVADESLVVPIGDEATAFCGVVAVSNAAAFLLRQMRIPKTENELAQLLVGEYGIDMQRATEDVAQLIPTLFDLGLITE